MPLSPLERKAALVMKRVRQADIARKLKVSQSYVSDVIQGNRRSERIERAIARAIDQPVQDVFPPREAFVA